MATTYNYTVESDFPNSQVNLDNLTEEINVSDITTVLAYITVDQGICHVYFESNLSSSEEAILGAIISSHDGTPTEDDVVLLSGINFASASAEKEASTNSTSYIQRLQLYAEGLSAGTYRIGWYYEWKRNTVSNNFMARIQINDTDTIMEQEEETKDTKSWHIEGGFYIVELSSGTCNIDFDYAGGSSNDNSYIRRVRIEIWRVA